MQDRQQRTAAFPVAAEDIRVHYSLGFAARFPLEWRTPQTAHRTPHTAHRCNSRCIEQGAVFCFATCLAQVDHSAPALGNVSTCIAFGGSVSLTMNRLFASSSRGLLTPARYSPPVGCWVQLTPSLFSKFLAGLPHPLPFPGIMHLATVLPVQVPEAKPKHQATRLHPLQHSLSTDRSKVTGITSHLRR